MTSTTRLPGEELYPPTPELDRQIALVRTGRPGAVQEFLDWLLDEQGYVLAKYQDRVEPGVYSEQPVEQHVRPEQLMADHFGIDLRKIEAERRAVLDWLQRQDVAVTPTGD
jgi:hypothetical protein